MSEFESESLLLDIECYERHESSLVSSEPYCNKAKYTTSMQQATIGFYATEGRLTADQENILVSKTGKRESTGTKKETKEKAKEQKQCILST